MLIFTYFLATAAFFFQTFSLVQIPINAYAPWIALAILKCSPPQNSSKIFWLSAATGAFADLFSGYPVGFNALPYTCAAILLLPFRNRFLYERSFHLVLFSSAVSLAFSLFQIFFLFLFDRSGQISGQWIIADRAGVVLADGAYALVWFSGPLYLWVKVRRIWVVFWLKKKLSRNSP